MPSSRLVILPYKPGSRSSRFLAQALAERIGRRVRRVRHEGTYRQRLNSLVVNYGSAITPRWLLNPVNWLNPPLAVSVSSNKLSAFRIFTQENIPCPEWTDQREVAQQWLNDEKIVVCRTLLNAHSGRGIIITTCSGPTPLAQSPLYVLYKRKRKEFRVHVFNGRVIDVSQKRRRSGTEDGGYIRNLANGWVFCRDGIVEPANLRDLATKAVAALGLNFGACDIIWNEHENKCYVLEVNTAPGLEGTTLQRYADAIYQWYRNQA